MNWIEVAIQASTLMIKSAVNSKDEIVSNKRLKLEPRGPLSRRWGAWTAQMAPAVLSCDETHNAKLQYIDKLSHFVGKD